MYNGDKFKNEFVEDIYYCHDKVQNKDYYLRITYLKAIKYSGYNPADKKTSMQVGVRNMIKNMNLKMISNDPKQKQKVKTLSINCIVANDEG